MDSDFDFDLEDRENFKIDPELWLHTLLAITGDKEKRAQMIERISEKTSISHDQVKLIVRTIIGLLLNQTRAN